MRPGSTKGDRNSMKTPFTSIVLFLLAALLGALGQYLYKAGADAAGRSLLSYLVNVRILMGVACYVAVMVLFVAAFRKGGSLTVLYPLYATTFIWAALIALMAYGTPIKPVNVVGMAVLIAGMYLMGR
jgi:multidrug transporter EmrE-like cation transporter